MTLALAQPWPECPLQDMVAVRAGLCVQPYKPFSSYVSNNDSFPFPSLCLPLSLKKYFLF